MSTAISRRGALTGAVAVVAGGIAGFAKVDRMMVSKILRLLEAKGYVARTTHPDDPRANRVDLTRSGRAAV